mmetsp:Transcript_60821/g.130728  ORF Transcript_60821/g.130728 Transcript_60821/m.130728 type:complete len:348 (-) Transcript_60821:41-1084(-)
MRGAIGSARLWLPSPPIPSNSAADGCDTASASTLAVDVDLKCHGDVLLGLEATLHVRLAEVEDRSVLDRLAPRLRILLHLHHLLLDHWRQGLRSVHGDEAPALLPVVGSDDARVGLRLEHLAALQVLHEEGRAAGHGHVVGQEMTSLVLDDAKLHRCVLSDALGPLPTAVHLGHLHPELLGHLLIELVALGHGHIAEAPDRGVEFERARVAQVLRTHKGLLLRIDRILVRNLLASWQHHGLRPQGGAASRLPLHDPELNLLVLHQERVAVLGLDIAPVHVQLVLRDNALLVHSDEAIATPLVVVQDCARELRLLVDFKLRRHGWRRPAAPPTSCTALLESHRDIYAG